MVGTRKTEWLRKNVGAFVRQYERKAQRGVEPNDRQYDRKVESELKRMDPFELDALLNGDGGNELREHGSVQESGTSATVTVVGWATDTLTASGWGEHALSQFRKELRRSVSLPLTERRELERGVRAKELVVIRNVQDSAVHGLHLILEALGAEVVVSKSEV